MILVNKREIPDELKYYEKLYLTKEDMLKVISNAEKSIEGSDVMTMKKKLKLKLGVSGIKMLVGMTDEETLNVIWNEILIFTDDLRYKNAKKGNPLLDILKEVKEVPKD